ncbi:MAG: MBL fold metallo-hydrolase [Dehalococcoidia bacterium]
MSLSIAFHGAAGTVTGSRYLVHADDTRVLVDCGMFQGPRELRDLNWMPTPFPPNAPEAVLITHAHIDHTGLLPKLVKEGYRGPIYCTPATAEMVRILLLDSAKLQEEDAEYANRKGYSKHHPALPLYTTKDVERCLSRIKTVAYRKPFKVGKNVTARFLNAGHILGSAMIQLDCETKAGSASIVFSGDVGRFGAPLHSDPDPLPECDVLVLESTYGDRSHGTEPIEDQMEEAFAAAIKRKGIILIPSFAVARAQLVALILRNLIHAGRLPDIPIHVDSPMASDVTAIYNRYITSESLDQNIPNTTSKTLFPKNVRFHRTTKESIELNAMQGPRIIISSSGMLAGGRVLHHLRRLAPNPDNLIALVGYQAVGTRGRDLVEGKRILRVHGQDVKVEAEVVNLNGLSAHADRDELFRWVGAQPKRPRAIYLTHGDPEPREAMRAALYEQFEIIGLLPELNQEHDLAWLFHGER